MQHELTGFVLKMNRAETHLNAIKEAIGRYGQTDFYEIATKPDYQRRPTARFHNVSPPDPAIAVLIGDCVHNFRSALDHLAFQLAAGHSGTLTEQQIKSLSFPIFDTGPKFRGMKGRGRGAAHKMSGMSRSARAAIERLQPYHRRKHPELWALWMLDEMWQVDKHRLVHLTGAIPAEGNLQVTGVNAQRVGLQHFMGPIEDGAKLVRVLGDLPDPANVQVHAKVTPDIVFDQRTEAASVRGKPVLHILHAIREVIGLRVLPELDAELHRLFPRIRLGITVGDAPSPH